MTLTTEKLSAPTTKRDTAPEVQRLLDERRELMEYEIRFGERSRASRLAMIEEELAALEDKRIDAEQEIRLNHAALRERYEEVFARAYEIETERCDIREELLDITTRLQAVRRQAHNEGMEIPEIDSFAKRVTGPGGDEVAWAARRLQGRIRRLARVPW